MINWLQHSSLLFKMATRLARLFGKSGGKGKYVAPTTIKLETNGVVEPSVSGFKKFVTSISGSKKKAEAKPIQKKRVNNQTPKPSGRKGFLNKVTPLLQQVKAVGQKVVEPFKERQSSRNVGLSSNRAAPNSSTTKNGATKKMVKTFSSKSENSGENSGDRRNKIAPKSSTSKNGATRKMAKTVSSKGENSGDRRNKIAPKSSTAKNGATRKMAKTVSSKSENSGDRRNKIAPKSSTAKNGATRKMAKTVSSKGENSGDRRNKIAPKSSTAKNGATKKMAKTVSSKGENSGDRRNKIVPKSSTTKNGTSKTMTKISKNKGENSSARTNKDLSEYEEFIMPSQASSEYERYVNISKVPRTGKTSSARDIRMGITVRVDRTPDWKSPIEKWFAYRIVDYIGEDHFCQNCGHTVDFENEFCRYCEQMMNLDNDTNDSEQADTSSNDNIAFFQDYDSYDITLNDEEVPFPVASYSANTI